MSFLSMRVTSTDGGLCAVCSPLMTCTCAWPPPTSTMRRGIDASALDSSDCMAVGVCGATVRLDAGQLRRAPVTWIHNTMSRD